MLGKLLINRELLLQLTRFIFAGAYVNAISLGVYLLLTDIFGFSALFAATVTSVAGNISLFVINKLSVFRALGTKVVVEFAKFIVWNSWAILLNLAILYIFHTKLGFNDLIVILCSLCFISGLSFCVQKWLIFSKKT